MRGSHIFIRFNSHFHFLVRKIIIKTNSQLSSSNFIIKTKPIIKLSKQGSMSHNQAVQPHQQDDCEDCQKQRAQNNQLIDFYQRLNKIKSKVKQMKPELSQHCAAHKDERNKLNKMSDKIANPPQMQMNSIDSKQMGYQLACALLEREIKIRRQNDQLNKKIKQVKANNDIVQQNLRKSGIHKKDSEAQSQAHDDTFANRFYNANNAQNFQNRNKKSKSLFSDSLDHALQQNNKSFWGTPQISSILKNKSNQQTSRYSVSLHERDNNNSHLESSTFSSFQQTERSVFAPIHDQAKKKYDNINLWLYQFNTEQQPSKMYKIKNKNSLKKQK